MSKNRKAIRFTVPTRVKARTGVRPTRVFSSSPSKKKSSRSFALDEDSFLSPRTPRTLPHEFVLDALASVSPVTKPMFGCIAIYVGEKIVLVLRQRKDEVQDNGVWIATTQEHHESLKRDFPSMRSISVFGTPVTGWQVLPENEPDFEESALKACQLILDGDARIGKVPAQKKRPRT